MKAEIMKKIKNLDELHYLKIGFENKDYIKQLIIKLKSLKKCLTENEFKELINKKLQLDLDKFDEAQFIQIASELTILAFFAENYSKYFKYEEKVNPPKDIDCSFMIDNLKFNIEVKCIDNSKFEQEIEEGTKNKVYAYGLHPQEDFKDMQDKFNGITSKHNTLKDFLISAQEKFSDTFNKKELNILVICIGDIEVFDIWEGYLYGNYGVLTDNPFLEHKKFDKVDCIIFTNLYHRHKNYMKLNKVWSFSKSFNILHLNKYSKIYSKDSDMPAIFIDSFPNLSREIIEYKVPAPYPQEFRTSFYVKQVLEPKGDIRF